ncbi:polysaccharide deacetylase family protein [Azospirillum isscasi]|uniref:Polysaccharide deacetylase n=1 Tax=Azospirillum isscasi TaxID=3053926 RepID=A0ABU0WM85_9PROT|nr:hypothetical protein [Azospirillum isscasi]MDQ2105346.1 hypothetical protein [Azospirillum isscasi]
MAAVSRYCRPGGASLLLELPVPTAQWAETAMPPRLVAVPMPGWAADLGVPEAENGLLVPEDAIVPGDGALWRRTAWFSAVAWFLHGQAERAHEAVSGPIHSYRLRLGGWDDRLWDRAWVNRIALFLRRWAARRAGAGEAALFGPLPDADIILTHDLDAIRKTSAIRIKQAAFHLFNAVRALGRGKPGEGLRRLGCALRFAAGPNDEAGLDSLATLVARHGMTARLHVHGGGGKGRRISRWLLDPAYDPMALPLASTLRDLAARGWDIGLHPSFHAWTDRNALIAERERVEQALDAPVTACRQHWLRFSWAATWAAQAGAGLRTDTTLGFNDRSGFRNGAALAVQPWDCAAAAPLPIVAMPLVLMDSHLFDYALLESAGRHAAIDRWIGEIRAVRGIASVLWHPHTLGRDYGWRPEFEALLTQLSGLNRGAVG